MPAHTTTLPLELQNAYGQACYRVYVRAGVVVTLKVGQPCDWMAEQLQQRQVHGACYLTACNPWGERLDAAANTTRMAALRQQLQRQGMDYHRGLGEDPQSQWPAEDSVLIWDLGQTRSLQWQQNAVLWSGPDGVPELLWLR